MTRHPIGSEILTTFAVLTAVALTIIALPGLAQDRSIDERIGALSSPDPHARAMAACELGRGRVADVRAAREALLAMIGDDTPVEPRLCRDWDSRFGRDEGSSPGREAAMALEELGTDVLPELTALLRDSRPAAREHAAFALGLIESEQSVEPLARVLNDSESRVRSRAAWGLGMIESTRGVEPLLEVLGSDADAEVRRDAAWALGMIESSAGVDGLAAAAADSETRVREQVAWALGMIESRAGVAALELLLLDDSASVRRQAAWGLGMVEDAGAVEALIPVLGDSEARVREQVAWALGMIESGSATEAIADALENETDDRVRRQLIWALGRVIDTAALQIEPAELAALLRRALIDREL